jgi:hypothetical protein
MSKALWLPPMRWRFIAIATLALLAAACSTDEGEPVSGLITADNIALLLTAGEVDAVARDDVDVKSTVVNLLDRAEAERLDELAEVETWFGVDFAETVDGSRMVLSVVDHVDAVAGTARFEDIVAELGLVESQQGIGQRFAGLSPRTAGVHTIVLFLVDDKAVVLTTTFTLTDNFPLLESEAVVELARLVATRFIP